MSSESKLILVTGANGFIAAHVVRNLLENSYHVRGTVRSEASAEEVRKLHHAYAGQLSVVTVPDLTSTGAFDQAVQGVQGVMHIASPFTFSVQDNETDMLLPAIRGTEGILESVAAHAPEAKRVVVTSSFAALADLTKGPWPGHTYTEADWNNVTYDYAKTANAGVAYCASKALAEKAAWKFIEDKKPHFNLSVLNPPMVLGPTVHDVSFSAPNVAAWDMNRFVSGELDDVPETTFWGFVDVRDLARAHVLALEKSEAANQRFFTAAGRYSYQQLADILRDSPHISSSDRKKVPVGKPGQNYPGPDVYEVDNSKSKKVLGVTYRSLEDSVIDAALNMIELRKNL